MDPDRILAHEGYNLRSTSRLSARDEPWLPAWLSGRHPLNRAFRKMRDEGRINRKEFYETVFVLDRLRDWLQVAPPVLYDFGAGHGLVGMLAAMLAPGRVREVVPVDRREPRSHERLREALALVAPWVKVRTRYCESKLGELPRLRSEAWGVAVHACGGLTDQVAKVSAAASIPFVVVPCCESKGCLPDPENRESGLPVAERVNAARLERWRSWGYSVEERALPLRVTARTRMFLCRPDRATTAPKAARRRARP
jgi:hypothetical protein